MKNGVTLLSTRCFSQNLRHPKRRRPRQRHLNLRRLNFRRLNVHGWILQGLLLHCLIMVGVFGCNARMPTITASLAESQKEPNEIVKLWPIVPGTTVATQQLVSDRHTHGRHDRLIRGIINPNLRVFLPEVSDPNHSACIICPGGGYTYLAVDKEGNDVAQLLNAHGITAFVLEYRLPMDQPPAPGEVPAPLADVHRAIRLVRASAGRWHIDPDRIGIMGFSAGGHVAGSGATSFDTGIAADPDRVQRLSSRPDFAVLMYPVLSMHDPVAHKGSRHNLLGEAASTALMDQYSVDQNVTTLTPPLFLCHAEDDYAVPVQNSLQMVSAAVRARVPCELVLLKSGGHGFGLGEAGHETSTWFARLIDWMKSRDIIAP